MDDTLMEVGNAPTETAGGKKEKSQKPLNFAKVRERIEELVTLYHYAKSARIEFSEAIRTTAEAAGLKPSVLRKFVNARATDYPKAYVDQEQLSLCFDEVGQRTTA